MADVDTREESYALQAAANEYREESFALQAAANEYNKKLEDIGYPSDMDSTQRAAFRHGWIAGREWQKIQEDNS